MNPERTDRDKKALVAAIFQHLQKGARPSQLPELIWESHRIRVTREHASRLLWEAATSGSLRFVSDTDDLLALALKKRFDELWGEKARFFGLPTVAPGSVDQLAVHGAAALLRIIEHRWREKLKSAGPREIRIGFSGGLTPALVLEELPKLIKGEWKVYDVPTDTYPTRITFHALNALLGNGNPVFNPSRYFPSFGGEFPVETRFVSFPAPGVLLADEWESVRKLQGVREALYYADKLDIILGSGGHWGAGHHTVQDYVTQSCIKDHGTPGEGVSLLDLWTTEASSLAPEAGCVGDLFWQRVFSGAYGSTRAPRVIVPSLFQLADLPNFIQNGTRVLLVLGPCSGCDRPKDQLLEAAIQFPTPPLITDLVVTAKTANAFLRRSHQKARAE